MNQGSPPHHFTVDVEEHFQVSALEPFVDRAEWDSLPSRVERSTDRILELLAEHEIQGTFFTLGWVARRHPGLVRRIAAAGHEIASHGWDHRRVTQLDPEEFRVQVRDSRAILEDLSAQAVEGYRAPSFSITRDRAWALEILVEEGYLYDSSLYPVRRPGYGWAGGSRFPHVHRLAAGPLVELPPMTVRIGGWVLPAGGGGTFRQLPLAWSRRGFRVAERSSSPGTFYIHPWEVDPEQPRVPGLPVLTRIRHYRGLNRTLERLTRLIQGLRFRTMRESARALSNSFVMLLIVFVGGLSGCGEGGWEGPVAERSGAPPVLPACGFRAGDIQIEELATGLEVPWDLAAAPDGRIFVTERPGRIRVIRESGLEPDPWFTLEVAGEPGLEVGLLGIALAPDFSQTGELFVASVHERESSGAGIPILGRLIRSLRLRLPGDRGVPFELRVTRLAERDGTVSESTPWLTGLPAGRLHAGGALLVTPDRRLVLSVGDGTDPWVAQDPRSPRGAILTVPATGGPPAGGAVDAPGDLVATGIRNSQGMALLGNGGDRIVFVDHGPSGLTAEQGRQGADELNVLEMGANYGWPAEAGVIEGSVFRSPLAEWTPAIAPAGLAVLPSAGSEGGGDPSPWIAVVPGLRAGAVRLVGLGPGRDRGPDDRSRAAERDSEMPPIVAECETVLDLADRGRIRAVEAVGPREILVTTSNRDGRGRPRPGDDRLLRVRWSWYDA